MLCRKSTLEIYLLKASKARANLIKTKQFEIKIEHRAKKGEKVRNQHKKNKKTEYVIIKDMESRRYRLVFSR